MDLRAKAVDALRVVHQWGFLAGSTVKTSEADAVGDRSAVLVGFGALFVGACGDVAGYHAESGGEGREGSVVAAAEVVDYHAAVGDFFEGPVFVLVVEERGPIRGFVILDLAGGAVCLLERVEG